MTDLSTTVAGMGFPNPVMLASGILDETGASMARVIREGAGGVVTKSIGLEPRLGHPNPTVVEVQGGLLNAMGLPNPGMAAYADEIREAKREGEKRGTPVIASIFGANPEDFAILARMAKDAGADGIELNLSCPHAKGLGLEMGQDPLMVRDIMKAAKASSALPIFPKLSPHVNDLEGMAQAAEDGGADGIVVINTLRGMAIDVEARSPVLGNMTGGLSGLAIKPVGLRVVYELYQHTELPIIGVGGIGSGRDALEYIMAGASLVQVGTAILYRGPGACGMVAKELEVELERLGYANVEEAVGAAHEGAGDCGRRIDGERGQ